MGKILKFYEGDQATIVRTTAPALETATTDKILMAQYVGNDVYAMVIEEDKVKYAPFDASKWPFINGIDTYLSVVPGAEKTGVATITDVSFNAINNTTFNEGIVASATATMEAAGIVYEGDSVVVNVVFTADAGYTFETPIVKVNGQTFVGEITDGDAQTLTVSVPVIVTK